MKRTTIYLDPGLELRLKAEALRRKQPMARAACAKRSRIYLTREPDDRTARRRRRLCQRPARYRPDRVDEVLTETGFWPRAPAAAAPKRRAALAEQPREARAREPPCSTPASSTRITIAATTGTPARAALLAAPSRAD